MKLQEWPTTEQQYWEAIESLGSFRYSINHGLSHGRIEDLTGEVARDEFNAGDIQKKLVMELEEKFGIISPMTNNFRGDVEGKYPAPPEGKRWYWQWYQQTKEQWLKSEYEKHICSACSLSTHDLDTFRTQIPCQAFRGSMYRLRVPSMCGMLTAGDWTRDRLMRELMLKGGHEAIVKFKAKEAELSQ